MKKLITFISLCLFSLTVCAQALPVLDMAEYIGVEDTGDYFVGTEVETVLQELGAASGGSAIILDLADDGSNESTDLNEIAITNDTNSIFSEPTADKLLINVSNNWPIADEAKALIIPVKEENTSAIVKGQVIYTSGSAGAGQSLVGLVDNTDSTKIRMLGLAAEAIVQNAAGTAIFRGELSGVDTLGANAVNPNDETWAAGALLYATTAGGLTNVKPTSGRIIRAAYSLVGSHNNDTLLVHPHENPICLAAASGEDICIRMGDNDGANKVCFRDYANNIVACIDSNGLIETLVGIDGIGAVDMDYGSADILDHTFTTNDCTFIIDGGITVSTGDIIRIGTTQWNSADEMDGTKIKDADYGDVVINAAGAWNVQEAESGDTATAFFGAGTIEKERLPDASTTADGVVELATTAEVNTGTSATLAITPDSLAGSIHGKDKVYIKVIAYDTAVTTGNGKAYFTITSDLNGMNLVDADVAIYTASSSGNPSWQIHNLTDTTDMLSTNITIDAGSELNSYTAATPPVIDTGADDVATGDVLRIDCDVAGTGTKGTDVILVFATP